MNNPQAPKRKKQGVKSGQHRKLKRSIKIRKLTINIAKNVICMEQQTWPYVIVLYKYFTLTDKAMYLLQGRVSIKPINVTTK